MLRWTLLLLAIASTALCVVGYLMHPPIAESADKLGVAETTALFGAHDRILVTVDAGADVRRPVYPAVVERPAYTRRPPAETHTLPDPATWSEDVVAAHLGASVRFEGAAGGAGIALQGVEDRTLQEDVVRSERLLVPVDGTRGRVWALSPVFRAGEPARGWVDRSHFEGVLTRLADIGVNTATWNLEFSFEEIASLAAEQGLTVDADTLLVIDGAPAPKGDLFYLPVEGAGARLLLGPFYESESLPGWVAAGPVTGVMWVWDVEDEERAGLEAVLGGGLGDRFGVIHHDDTAIELNEKTKTGLKVFTGLGGVLFTLSIVFFTTHRLRRRRALEAAHA